MKLASLISNCLYFGWVLMSSSTLRIQSHHTVDLNPANKHGNKLQKMVTVTSF